MQVSHLRTLLAIRDSGSFSAASDMVNLSHSAVSIQMKRLEEQLNAPLFEKGRRPALMTPLGEEIAEKAQQIIDQIDGLRSHATTDDLGGHVRLGFVATTLQTLLPVVLTKLRQDFPELKVSVHSGLSDQLVQSVESHDIDFAFISAPASTHPKARMYEIGLEPLYTVTSKSQTTPQRADDILRQNPFISFNRSTFLGQQIASHLAQRGIMIEPDIELDSIDAIEYLVAQGFGVSILPQRLLAEPMQNTLRCIPFGSPVQVRRIMLATPRQCRRQSLLRCLKEVAQKS